MCGIAGILESPPHASAEELGARVDAMAASLARRGPDGSGTWTDAEAGIAFGHRRLAILDLSAAGAQPMVSRSGRWVVTYNGELYNAPEIAVELESAGVRFRGHSDTEVLVEAVDAWGLLRALRRTNGMFALALWDRAERGLHLARDRFGEKPLYYAHAGPRFLFGSELKALRAHPGFSPEIDRDSLTAYLRFGYVPAPGSIYRDVCKLPPGTVLSVKVGRSGDPDAPVPYWRLPELGTEKSSAPADELLDRAHDLLLDAVRARMRSDVPLGAFLSGGIDSSTVVALMQATSVRPVRTFTIGSRASTHDEASAARAVADHLGTEHTELIATSGDTLAVIERLPEIYDEPFADPSQIPTRLVAELARQQVTVSLSGDAGDELFGGYNRYRWVPRLARRLRVVPGPVRRAAARGALAVPEFVWDASARALPSRLRPQFPAVKIAKLAAISSERDPAAMYRILASVWDRPEHLVVEGREPRTALDDAGNGWEPSAAAARMMAIDARTYLPDDILVKVDRATMDVGLEARVPFLDHRVVELASTLPTELTFGGAGKWALRSVLDRYMPAALVDRPKAGFDLPIGEWLRGPLRPWAEELLDPARLRREGYLQPEPVSAVWHEHLSRRRSHEYRLWTVLMFQSWLEAASVAT